MTTNPKSETTHKHSVLVIGSGLAAYGACLALLKDSDVKVTVMDIGLKKPYQHQPNAAVPNSVEVSGSYYPYGINDKRWPIILDSQRMCSSHALGGYSKVYSGSILKPIDKDMADWPEQSKPSIDDYNDVLSTLRIWQTEDELNEAFSCFPIIEGRVVNKNTYAGKPRIALSKSIDAETPYECGADFQQWEEEGKISYHSNHYVTKLTNLGDRIEVTFETLANSATMLFDKVYVGAGCINTTAIVDRSLFGVGSRSYPIKSAEGLLQLHLQLWAPRSGYWSIDHTTIKNPDICKVFVEHQSYATGWFWSHTQINTFNRTILQTIRRKLPPFISKLILVIHVFFRFSITVFHSNLGPSSMLISSVEEDAKGHIQQKIKVHEKSSFCNERRARAISLAIFKKFFSLGLVPIPFGRHIAYIMKGNRLGGWHYGGTLPMIEMPTDPIHTRPNGELYGMPNVFVIDASGFPSIPGSTVALLTIANSYRIAKNSISDSTS